MYILTLENTSDNKQFKFYVFTSIKKLRKEIYDYISQNYYLFLKDCQIDVILKEKIVLLINNENTIHLKIKDVNKKELNKSLSNKFTKFLELKNIPRIDVKQIDCYDYSYYQGEFTYY